MPGQEKDEQFNERIPFIPVKIFDESKTEELIQKIKAKLEQLEEEAIKALTVEQHKILKYVDEKKDEYYPVQTDFLYKSHGKEAVLELTRMGFLTITYENMKGPAAPLVLYYRHTTRVAVARLTEMGLKAIGKEQNVTRPPE